MQASASPAHEAIGLLSSLELFRGVSDVVLREIAAGLEEQAVPAGATLIGQGQTDDNLHIVKTGRLRVSVQVDGREEELAYRNPGDIVGEAAFLSGQRRTANVAAVEDTRVWALSRAAYHEVEHRHPDAAAAISRVLITSLRRSQLATALRHSRVFGSLPNELLREIELELELITFIGGEVLFRQGDAGDSLCLIVNGRVRVSAERKTGGEQLLSELGPGETVGEMALLSGEPRSATVYAVRDTNIAKLSRESFDRLAAHGPQLVTALSQSVIERIQRQSKGTVQKSQAPKTIAIVPISEGVDVSTFCAALTDAIGAFGSAIHLNGQKFDQALAKPGASQVAEDHPSHSLLAERLAFLEADHHFVLYQTDIGDSAWTRRCARQAEHILLVGAASADPKPNALERVVVSIAEQTRSPVSLVLLHESKCRLPSGTKDWLALRHVEQPYHVRAGEQADVERLARILTARAVALVLGGGFARGLAHAGVIRALHEIGIPVDLVGGTSMGAIMAIQCAMGYDADGMLQQTIETTRACFKGELTLPIVAFLKGDAAARSFSKVLGGLPVDMEDLWLPCFVVSANLTRAKALIHSRGSLLKSVLASSRAPGMYPPIVWDGDLLIDGGILNNLPADVMKVFSKGAKVIAVDVSPTFDPAMVADYGLSVSGWRALIERWNPFSQKPPDSPHLLSILLRLLELGDAARGQSGREAADLYLSPPLETFKRGDFQLGREMADVAYRYALPLLQEWKATLR